jgi:uroporphyrin-III C-methyltransferase
VFGRGGEEAAVLRAAGIDVDVVNGITSGLAAATSIGVPLTHRAHAHGVALVAGHECDDAECGPDWGALVRSGLTIVIYMGIAHAAQIRTRLLAAGMAPGTPVAIIANATRPEQREAVGTLDDLVDVIRDARIASPAIIMAGDVAALATPSAAGAIEHAAVGARR